MHTSSVAPRIAAVVLTHNRCDLLEEGLEALLHQTRPLDEIVVIDNASTDNTREVLKEKFKRQVTCVRLDENMGSAGGFYEGIRLACEKGYDWIWVMDDDVKPSADALKALVDSPAFDDPSVGLLASLVLDVKPKSKMLPYEDFNRVMAASPDCEGTWFPIGTANYRLFTSTLGFRPAVTRETLNSPLVPVEGVGFLGILIRRSALTSVGLPLKELFFFWDDLELAYRISRKFKMFAVPASRVFHGHGGDLRSPRRFLGFSKRGAGVPIEHISRSYYFYRNEIYVRTKYAKPWLAPFIPLALFAKCAAAALFFYDHPFARFKIVFQATLHAVLGRLEKRIGP